MMNNRFELLDDFNVLLDFKLIEASTSANDDEIICLRFANEKNVCIDVMFMAGEYFICEPYAIDMFKGIEYEKRCCRC